MGETTIGVYAPSTAVARELRAVLAPWFGQTRFVPRAGRVPPHVVGWECRRGDLSVRDRAAIAVRAYAAGAAEVWLMGGSGDPDVMLPRLLITVAAA